MKVALNEWQLVIARLRTNGSIELFVVNDNTRPVVIPATPTVSCPATGATFVDLNGNISILIGTVLYYFNFT